MDPTPTYSDSYKPKSPKFRFKANIKMSHSIRYNLVIIVISIISSNKKFLYKIVRS
jgi:hypothetical protein